MKKRAFLAGLALALVVTVLPMEPTHAATNTSYRVVSRYQVKKSGVTLRQTFTATNLTPAAPPTTLTVPVAGSSISALKATNGNGSEATATYQAETGEIKVDLSPGARGSGKTWKFTLSYKTDLGQGFGKVFAFQAPALDWEGLEITSEAREVSSDLELGLGLSRGERPQRSQLAADAQVLTWQNNQGALAKPVSLFFGDTATTAVELKHTFTNPGWWWRTFTLTLPPDTNQQQVFIDSITPKPTKLRLDIDGNVLAEYRLGPRRSLAVTAKALVVNHNYSYAFHTQKPVGQADQALRDRYTALTGAWQDSAVNPAVTADMPASQAVRKIYDAVIKASSGSEVNYEQSKALSDQLIGELRAADIPARGVFGRVMSDGNRLVREPISHAWVEAYVAGVGWMTLDPSFGRLSSQFGTTDVLHVGLVLRGQSPDFPPEQLDGASLSYLDQEPPTLEAAKPTLNAINYMLLPGLALREITVTMPSGRVVDDAAVTSDAGGGVVALGSLAPLQEAHVRTVAGLANAFTSSTVQYGLIQDNGGIAEPLAQTTTTVSYLPLGLLAGLFILGLILHFWTRGRRRNRQTDALIDEAFDLEAKDIDSFTPEEAPSRQEAGGDTIESEQPPAWRAPARDDAPRKPPRKPLIQG